MVTQTYQFKAPSVIVNGPGSAKEVGPGLFEGLQPLFGIILRGLHNHLIVHGEGNTRRLQGFFNVPVDHLFASAMFIPFIRSMGLNDIVIASPDVGGTKRANTYARLLETDMVICHKSRAKANVVDSMTLIGEVTGKDVIIVDDMIDTAGTIKKAAQLMLDKGAHSVRAFAAHGVLSGPAIENIESSLLEEVYFTDSLPRKNSCAKIKYISVADAFAEAIARVYKNQSISSLYFR